MCGVGTSGQKADRRGGAVVVFSHVDYSTTDADTLLLFVHSDSVWVFWIVYIAHC